ncbi:MAG TPA: hypothetical protein VKR43_09215 [Bryobacteraceae bacterium]|nr:hypothetical protein [Bryobacteraceae bacterium]
MPASRTKRKNPPPAPISKGKKISQQELETIEEVRVTYFNMVHRVRERFSQGDQIEDGALWLPDAIEPQLALIKMFTHSLVQNQSEEVLQEYAASLTTEAQVTRALCVLAAAGHKLLVAARTTQARA